MDVDFDFNADGALRRLEGMADRIESRSLLEQLTPDMQSYEEELFATEGHGEWAPNAPGTVENKGGSGRVLVHTGALMADLTSGRGDVSGDTLTLRTSQAYAGYLRRGARGMPPRDPAQPPESRTTQQWGSHLLRYVVDGHQL